MPKWISELIAVAPWLAALAVVAFVVVKLWPYMVKLMRFVDDVSGEPARPGFDARPGLMERLSIVETKQDEQAASIAIVRHEVTTNHGSSLKDSVKRLEDRFETHLENR